MAGPIGHHASAKGYAAIWLRRHPHSFRMRRSRTNYERKALEIGQIAIYSMLRDWIKGQITAIEEQQLRCAAQREAYALRTALSRIRDRLCKQPNLGPESIPP